MASAAMTFLLNGYGEPLQYVRGGAWYGLLTGQLVHWNAPMALVDLGLLAVAGWWIENRSRKTVVLALIMATTLCGVAVALSRDMTVYRGSSGLGVALVVVILLELSFSNRTRWLRIAAALALLLTVAKIVWEWRTGQALAGGTLPPGVVVAALVHLFGALSGIATFIAARKVFPAGA